MKKVLVTGANGLLGANIVRQLSLLGYKPKAMLRKGSNTLSLVGAEYELIEGEITNKDDVYKAVADCDFVIHNAAQTSQSLPNLAAYYEVNIEATKTIIEACKHFNVKRFVFVSTANCYTNGSIKNPGNETSKFMPWVVDSGYAYSKFLAQLRVLKEFTDNGFPSIVVNPTFMVGPYDAKPSSGKLLLHGYNSKIVFYPPGGKSIVDVEYAAQATCNALTLGKVGKAYLLAGKNITYKDFFKIIEKQSGKHKVLIPIPRTLLLTLGRVFSLIENIFSISLPLNNVNARLLGLDNYFSNRKAVAELDLQETDINNAVAKSITWFKQNGQIK
ncbi:MAG: NAD-dependent epimerase/dehydratase family protein [Bacteroidota bacterium]